MYTFKSKSSNVNSLSGIRAFTKWFRSKYQSSDVKKQFMVHPCQVDGQPTLVYERGLEHTDPEAYRHLCAYAAQNGYKVREDRRKDFIEGIKRVKNKQSANVMTIMVITGCLISPRAMAEFSGSAESLNRTDKHLITETAQINVMDSLLDTSVNLDSEMTETELMVVLLRWINKHSSFNHDLNDLPRILKVNKTQIAQIAFGRTLPAAIDPDTLGIKGLYNFNNRTIYILDNLDLSVEGDRAILLHELVHYLQYRYGDDKGAECKNELEKLAYRLEAEYLHSHNHKINFNANHIENVSRCT